MDVSLAAKARPCSTISCISVSSSSNYLLSSSKFRCLHTEFLGCGHNLRPPGLRSGRKCKKIGFHIQSPRFVVGASASLDSQPILVLVSVVAVSALTVVYLNYSKRKEIAKKISDPLDVEESQRIRAMINSEIADQILTPTDHWRKNAAGGKKDVPKELKKFSHESDDEPVEPKVREIGLVHEETLSMDKLTPPGSDFIAPSTTDSMSPRHCELFSLPDALPESGALSFSLVTEVGDIRLEGQRETEIGFEMPKLMTEAEITVAPIPANIVHAGVDETEKRNGEVNGEGSVHSYNRVGEEFVRQELHTFYSSNQYAMRSMDYLSGPKPMPSSYLKNKRVSSPKSGCTFEQENFPTREFLHTAGVPFHRRKDITRSQETGDNKEKGILNQEGHRTSSTLLHPKKKQISDINYPSQQLSAFNRFLRDGRLIDCLEKLEYLERKGLLNMDNVYHAGFFRACKSQKAVKEAFRFTNLIPNPTLSTFNMLMSVCASSQDVDGAFQVLQLVQNAGLKADCKLYTTLISTCARSRKVDTMFKVFHEMVNAGVEPNVHTYGALIDGCAKAGQVAKAFGAYGIMRSKNVKLDRVVFNALITACGQSGAVDRAFDVLSEMGAETQPIDPDHVTVGALMKACANAGQVDRAREVYSMIHAFNIKGTPELYTIAVNSCSQNGDWEFACSVYSDMTKKAVAPDEMFISALIDVAGHAGKLDAAFEILQEAKKGGIDTGIISYSSMMGACSNAKNWQKALELYEGIKAMGLKPVVSTMNALITALCEGDQLPKAVEVLSEMKREGLCPSTITYSILLVASEKKDDLEVGLMLLSQAKKDGLSLNLVMCRSLIAMCYRRYEKACTIGESVLSFNSGRLLIDIKWTSLGLMIYRETILAGVVPTMVELSQLLGCLRLPHDSSLKNRLIENLGVITATSKGSNLCSLIDGFGEYDPRAFSLLEEAASLGIVPCVSFKESPIVVDLVKLPIYTAEVYLLTVLKGLKHRLAAGARLPNISIVLPVVKTQVEASKGEKTINVSGRITQAITALLRRLRLSYLGNESYGKIRIHGVVVKRWFQPKLASPFSWKPTDFSSSKSRLGKAITNQQRDIRAGNLSLE